MSPELLEITGYVAGIFVAVSLMPQIIKSWHTKSTKDISFLWNSLYIVGLILWITYAYGTESWPLFFMATFETLMALSLLVLKIRYG